jgi:hypothetical protein
MADATKSDETDQWSWNSTESWHQTPFYGDKVAAGTSPSAVVINGEINVFFVDASKGNTITDWTSNSIEGWHQTFFHGDPVASDSSPSGLSPRPNPPGLSVAWLCYRDGIPGTLTQRRSTQRRP